MPGLAHPRDIFRSTASYYARYRPDYPPAFFDFLAARFGLDGSGRLLDLGCGTGRLAINLAHRFDEAVGADPEPEMLEEAGATAGSAGVTTIRGIEASSEDLPRLKGELGRFRLVTMEESLHWMDQDATLADLDHLVEPGGGIAITWLHHTGDAANGWREVMDAAVKRALGERRRAGSGFYTQHTDSFEDVVARSPFRRMEVLDEASSPFKLRQARDVDSVIGLAYSSSFASPYVLGDALPAFEADLRRALTEFAPSGIMEEELYAGAILAWRLEEA
jgi:ubiquinone/menaquinone biosynthesis C-methylase UbiE